MNRVQLEEVIDQALEEAGVSVDIVVVSAIAERINQYFEDHDLASFDDEWDEEADREYETYMDLAGMDAVPVVPDDPI